MKLQSLIKYSYVWSVHTQYIPTYQTVNNSMPLGFSFLFHFEVFCTNKPLILFYNEREHDLASLATVRCKFLTVENFDESGLGKV